MSRDAKASGLAPAAAARSRTAVELIASGEAAVLKVSGLIDEKFAGFGKIGAIKTLVINVAELTRMTSFGVRQWLKGMDGLPKTLADVYLLGCPTFFVDQLNMVLNFGGSAKILTVVAPYTCPSCGVESGEMIDVLAERANLTKGGPPEKECSRCGGTLEFDETPESYFSFVNMYGASSLKPAAAQLLAEQGMYTSTDSTAEKPPRIIKLVHGSVTYFRIIGTIGAMFRARPFLVGAEGEVVIDLAEVERFEPTAQKEWRRLLKSLAGQVPTITLVDVNESFLANAADTVAMARNIAVASVLVPYVCEACGRTSQDTENLLTGSGEALALGEHICSACGGTSRSPIRHELLAPLERVIAPPAASLKVIEQRVELVSRAMSTANVGQAGENATAAIGADDTILGKFKIVRRLSAGGMSEVFLAKQIGIGGFEKPVALRRIQRALLEARQQTVEVFLNEAKSAGRLTHPNIVQVLDIGEVGGALYLATEYVHGKDLRAIIRQLQARNAMIPLAEACYVIREAAQALDHAYWSTDMTGARLSVIHRDVSPNNIMVSYDGAVKLLDFGVAMSSTTDPGDAALVDKVRFMAPETATGGQVDHRSDLFSLGVILYQLCAGTAPFAGSDAKDTIKKIRAGRFRPLQEFPSIPDRLAALANRLLSANPDERPQRAQEVASELTEVARRSGLESSGPSLALLLGQLFPDEAGASTPDPVRSRSESRSAVILSPGSVSLPRTRSGSLGIDASMTLTPGAREQSASIPVGAGAKPASPAAPAPQTAAEQKPASPDAPADAIPKLRRPAAGAGFLLMCAIVLVALGIYLLVRPG